MSSLIMYIVNEKRHYKDIKIKKLFIKLFSKLKTLGTYIKFGIFVDYHV